MDTKIRVSTESWPQKRKFSHSSCRDSTPGPFDHKPGTLTAKLYPLCMCKQCLFYFTQKKKRKISVFLLFVLFHGGRVCRHTYRVDIRLMHVLYKRQALPNHTIIVPEHTHGCTINTVKCEFFCGIRWSYQSENNRYQITRDIIEHTRTLALCNVCAIKKTREKRSCSYTSHRNQKCSTTARGQDYCKHASQILFLHYQQCSFCTGKHE